MAEPSGGTGWIERPGAPRLQVREWRVEGARTTLAVVHGLGEHSGRYARLAAAMATRGCQVVAIDLRGHGASDGQRGHLHRWDDAIEDARALVDHAEHTWGGSTDIVPLGHSFGGVVVLSGLLGGQIKSRRAILSSPALRIRATVPAWKLQVGRVAGRLAPAMSLDNGLDPHFLSRDQSVGEAYSADPLVHRRITAGNYALWMAAAADVIDHADGIRQPMLLTHGTDDRIIDQSGTDEVAAKAPHATLRRYPDMRHEPFNELDNAIVFDDLAGWLEETRSTEGGDARSVLR